MPANNNNNNNNNSEVTMFWFGYCSVMSCLISSCVKESCLGQGTRQLIKSLTPGRNTDDKFVQLLTLTNYCFYDYEQNIEEIRTANFQRCNQKQQKVLHHRK